MQKHPVDDDIIPPNKPVVEELHFEYIENVGNFDTNVENNKAL